MLAKMTKTVEVEVVCSVEGCEVKTICEANMKVGYDGNVKAHSFMWGPGWRMVWSKAGVIQPPDEPVTVSGFRCLCPEHAKTPKHMKLAWKKDT